VLLGARPDLVADVVGVVLEHHVDGHHVHLVVVLVAGEEDRQRLVLVEEESFS
jgi:hypothetical protein